jgi:predicted dehydrogenase
MSICAACDTSHQRLSQVAGQLGVTKTFRDYQDMLDKCELDAVLIFTPPSFHRSQAELALARGVSVFCEKPMARTATECKSMLEMARSRNKLVMTGYAKRFNKCFKLARDMLLNGELGRILTVEVKWFFPGGNRPRTTKFWKDSAETGGGIIQDIGSHIIDMLLWWNGPVQTVFANASIGGVSKNTEDNSEILLLHSSGVSSHISISSLSNEGIIEQYTLIGTNNTLTLEMKNKDSFATIDPFSMLLLSSAQDARFCTRDITPMSDRILLQEIEAHSQSLQQMRHFVDRCSNGGFDAVIGSQGLGAAEIVDAIYLSILSRKAVEIPPDTLACYQDLFGEAGELRKRRAVSC